MPRFRIITFGCKVNQCDTAALAQELGRRGWEETRPGVAPELVVVNTCTVTARADQQARQAVRRLAREHPGAALWVTGCGAERDPASLAGLTGVCGVLGNREKGSLADLLAHPPRGTGAPLIRVGTGDYAGTFPKEPVTRLAGHTRGFLKVQDGCSHNCSYCIVPAVRGPGRSMEPERVQAHLVALAEQGVQEVVLTGVDLGQYGRDLQGEMDLASLLRRLGARPLPCRLRLSSLEPQEVTQDLLNTWAALPGACPHFHLPLQSGAADVLRAMHRPYQPQDFRDLAMEIRRRFPQAAIGLDVLTGFPTETSRDFGETLALLAALPVTYLHIFPYSPRPGTAAASLKPLPASEVKARAGRLRELAREKKETFLASQVGRVEEVLVERADARPGWLTGLTGNYLRVRLPGPAAWRNRRLLVRLVRTDGEILVGEAVQE